MAVVLGISPSHDASACVFHGETLLAAISEERLSRIKGDGFKFPQLAIDAVLNMAGMTRRDVDHVAMIYAWLPERYVRRPLWRKEIERRISRSLQRWLLRRESRSHTHLEQILRHIRDRAPHTRFDDYFRRDLFLAGEGFRPDAQPHFIDHHLTHAVTAAFYSGYPESAVVTMDGQGDLNVHHTSNVFRSGELRRLHFSDTPGASPGLFYGAITQLLGFQELRHEGKVLGLAAAGSPALLADALRKAMRLTPDGRRLDCEFVSLPFPQPRRKEFLASQINGHRREDVAAAAQIVFEDAIVTLTRNFLHESGMRRLALNGGVFANVKLNQRLAALPEVDGLFVFPGMSDTGNSVGAALAVLDRIEPGFLKRGSHPLRDLYLGPASTEAEIRAALDDRGLVYERLDEAVLVERAAAAVHAGRVIGWFQGRMEFGPRALGNRSIVARATDAGINASLNKRLERTEFMPFAPSALDEYADDLFEDVPKSRHAAEFMTVC
ncbi:MAG TPA: carbamoyltransferase N-terminal domain-containing protein, partial [Burkholderiales bacterium]|nr:carbamoyltransferase N-terminal domain-containing protein [Burkholderiales bacterium]